MSFRSSVRLGARDTKSNMNCEYDECSDPALDIPVAELIPHENYNPNSETSGDDIALIRLSKTVNFTDSVNPICLPTDESLRSLDSSVEHFSMEHFSTAGWGINETGRGH